MRRRTAGAAVALVCAALTAPLASAPMQAAYRPGGGGSDVLTGTATSDQLTGKSGDDVLLGYRGRDLLRGGKGPDTARGGAGRDRLFGGTGPDVLAGGPGGDTVTGGAGDDVLAGGTGPDQINCGSGSDVVFADSSDTVVGCEQDTVIQASPYRQSVDMAARLQWNANFGYCGETSFISAGMLFGQYTSQWTARNLASGGTDEWLQGSQLLLGAAPQGNALTAAAAMSLNATAINTTTQSTSAFLAWIKQHVVAGDVVIMGVYNNVNILGEDSPGDPDYDHIVPVMRVGSQQPLTGATASQYFASDTITISDNGLFTPHPNSQPNVPGNTPNNPAGSGLYTYRFGDFQKDRSQANRGWTVADLYSVRNTAPDFAVAVTGVLDTTPGGPVTVPVTLTSNTNNEGFQDQDYLYSAPSATSITLTATVTIPDQTQTYKLYRYTDFGEVPTESFNASAGQAAQVWTIPAHSGATFAVDVPAGSGDNQIFRAVPSSAP